MLSQKFHDYDIDAIKHCAKLNILKKGIGQFWSDLGIPYDKKMYAILSAQFDSKNDSGILVDSIHKVKGLEGDTAYFIICKSLLEILIGEKNNYDKETNLLYVALTRTKNCLLLIIDNNDYFASRDPVRSVAPYQ